MPWRRIVIRPDSIIRFWCVTSLDLPGELSRIHPSEHLSSITFSRFVALSDGSLHGDAAHLASFGAGMMKAAGEDPRVFEEIGEHYEEVLQRWLDFMDSLPSERQLASSSNKQLAELVEQFVAIYREYCPILFVPFIVERRYEAEFPSLVENIAEQLIQKGADVSDDREQALLAKLGVTRAARVHQLRDGVRAAAEYSPRRTVAEQKERRLLEIAAQAESDPSAGGLLLDRVPEPGSLRKAAPEVYQALVEALDRFGWLAHWGYPPRYSDSTLEDFIEEVRAKVITGARDQLDRERKEERENEEAHNALLNIVDLDERERQFLADINYYNFLRTYRMEVKMRCQYLSIPLFREIERRGIESGKLQRDDIFLLVPPETLDFLRSGEVPADIAERRDGWALLADDDGQPWRVLSGQALREFSDAFYGVIVFMENGRGTHNPTPEFVGGKGFGLFRLVGAGCEVPPFFVATTHAFQRFVDHNRLAPLLEKASKQLKAKDADTEKIAERLEAAVRDGELPRSVWGAINQTLAGLGVERVAVRSSALVEDSERFSWAGRFRSRLDVTEESLEDAIRDVWSSLFSSPALEYGANAGVDLTATPMAVVVQAMVPAEVAGVMNTAVADDSDVVEIEAALGYGEPVVAGEITPDRYLVDPAGEKPVMEATIADQDRQLGPKGWTDVKPDDGSRQKLDPEQLVELAKIGKRLESELGGPQDVEFAFAGGKLAMLQSRPLTGLDVTATVGSGDGVPPGARLLVSGLKGKVVGVTTGRAQVFTDLAAAKRDFTDGSILVTNAATPAWDPIVFRASALVTNEGGATSHAIRVSNERGIPAVVGAMTATDGIPDGADIAIDTKDDPLRGRIYLVP